MRPLTGSRPGRLGVAPVSTTRLPAVQCSQRAKVSPSRVFSKARTFDRPPHFLQMNC